jgi:hypothetical protein
VPWTPARVVGTIVVAGLTAGAALVLSDARVEVPDRVEAGATTTTTPAPADEDGASSSTTAAPASSTTTTSVEPPLTGPVRLVSTSRFDLRGVGPVEAGMTVHEAEQATGLRFTLTAMPTTNGRCSSATPAGLDGLTFIVAAPGGAAATDAKAGTIARAQATVAPFATVSNARVGATLAEARSIYAGRFEETRFGRGGVALTVKGRSGGDADKGVRIESTDGQQVTSLASGLLTALAAPDGCA